MVDRGLRDIGTIVPGARREPNPPSVQSPPLASHSSAPETVPASAPLFAADVPGGADALGLAAPLALLAELASHRRTETPLTIGLFGPSGSGKSFALTKLIEAIEHLSRAAGPQPSPFTGGIVALIADATDLTGNLATALAGALHSSLARTYPACAAEATHAARDPRAAATEALERLDTSRRKLEAEKRALDETNTRRARLAEAILYETAGSQVDAYAAANRTLIKSLFGRLGIAGDPLLAFKDMAGTAASTDGAARRAGFAPRAFFAFKGQTKLILAAIFLCLAGAGLRIAVDQQTVWLAWLRATESSVPIANWLEAHMDLLLRLREMLFVGAALAIGINVWRGSRLLRLVSRGADLLRADLGVRRRELGELFAFQARRVEALAADMSILSRRAAEAETRAGDAQAGNVTLAEPAPFAIDAATQQARAFAAAVGAMLARPEQASPNKTDGAPRRIVFAIDHLDAVAASRSREILAHARSMFGQGFVLLVAADMTRLAAGGAAPKLDKWIHVPFQLGQLASRANYAALVDQILGGPGGVERPVHNTSTSALDEPMSADEMRLLADLAPLAGSSARALKRFVNLYRVARTQNQLHKGALAFMLALDAGGTPAEIACVGDALSSASQEVDLDLRHCGARLHEALAAAQSAQGKIDVDDARNAAATASLFSFRDRGSSEGPAAV